METIYGVTYNPKLLTLYNITHETMMNDLDSVKAKVELLGSKKGSAKLTTEGGIYIITKGVLMSVEK